MEDKNTLSQYSGFDSRYIQALAQQKSYEYLRVLQPTEPEQGLYVNERTSARKEDALLFTVDGIECEYYMADFTPIFYAASATGEAVNKALTSNGDNTATRYKVQVFSIKLPYNVESVYVESRTNLTLNNVLGFSSVYFKHSERVRLEGDFNSFFRVHVPKSEEVNAFTILAPNIMALLLQRAGDYDIEFAGNRIYFYQTFGAVTNGKTPLKASTYIDLLEFGVDSAKTVVRASRAVEATDTDYVPMRTLYGQNAFLTAIILAGWIIFFFLFVYMVIIPPLWPILAILLSPIVIKYVFLLRRRKRLVANWANK